MLLLFWQCGEKKLPASQLEFSPGFLGKKNASCGMKQYDLLEEVLLQWIAVKGASGCLST